MVNHPTPLHIKNSCDLILNSVRNSSLNFAIQETPFSIYLTIRKTFNKSSPTFQQNCVQPIPIFEADQKEAEITTLKMKLKNVHESNEILKNDYSEPVDDSEQCRLQIKHLETIIDAMKKDYEESDVKKLVTDSKTKETIIEKLKADKHNIEQALETVEKNWKELNRTLKVKDKELHNTHKEKEKIQENLEKVRDEVKNLSIQVNKAKKAEAKKMRKVDKRDFIESLQAKTKEMECSECNFKVDSFVKMKIHVILAHGKSTTTQTNYKEFQEKNIQTCSLELSSDKNIQTVKDVIIGVDHDKFEKFNCYYCDKEIKSEPDLDNHRLECIHGQAISPSSLYLEQWEQWPCDNGEQEMRDPYNNYQNEEDLKCCDFCGREFGCLASLRNHIRSLHRDMLPT